MSAISKEFMKSTIARFRNYKDLGDRSFAQLNDWDFNYQPNDESNSIGTLIQHLSGNMLSRWTDFLKSDGEKNWRKRDEEFAKNEWSKLQYIELWEKGWDCLFNTLKTLKKKDLKAAVKIRKEPLSVIDAIERQLSHYAYHVGQIVYIAKIIKSNNWQTLSIAKGASEAYNKTAKIKDPAQKFR